MVSKKPEEMTTEEKEAENERIEALEEKQAKNRSRARKVQPKAVEPSPEMRGRNGDDLVIVECLKRISIDYPDVHGMSNVGEEVFLPREDAKLLIDVNAVKVKL